METPNSFLSWRHMFNSSGVYVDENPCIENECILLYSELREYFYYVRSMALKLEFTLLFSTSLHSWKIVMCRCNVWLLYSRSRSSENTWYYKKKPNVRLYLFCYLQSLIVWILVCSLRSLSHRTSVTYYFGYLSDTLPLWSDFQIVKKLFKINI